MRRILLLILATGLGLSAWSQLKLDNQITVPGDISTAVREAVDDMAYWLERGTGKRFTVTTDGSKHLNGIRLLSINNASLPEATTQKLRKDGQSFYLSAGNRTGVSIVGTGEKSFLNGIYTFLHELGFRWYMPGDAWTIVPSSFPSSLDINKVYTPDFQGRFYAGTGGVNAIAGTDPKNTFRTDFNTWNRRNRFSIDYAIKGHTGQAFYAANKKVLDQNPAWSCGPGTNRYGRIDISKPAAVNLFVDWALSQVKPGDQFPAIGVDPADGAGRADDCLPSNMPQIKTWSDKYFWLANQVAKRLDKNDTTTQVQLYAYAGHAEPPSIELEKNVYPIIIPYAFQRITSPLEFIRLWSSKMNGRAMGMYDYWNITQWSNGVPQFNIYSIPERLRLWKQYNITSINIETTNGKGAMGHALWLASHMMWDTRLSFDSLYHDFLVNCFGPAANDVKRMYDRWSQNYQQQMEVNLSLDDLARASAKTTDPAIQARLAELKAYVHYMKLHYDYLANPNSAKAYQDITNYIHQIHDLRLVQTSALLERYIKAPKNYKGTLNKQKPVKTPVISSTAIETQFRKNINENAVTYKVSRFKFDITKARVIASEKVANPRTMNGRNVYQFHMPAEGVFEIKAGATKETNLLIADDKKTWLEKMIPGTKDSYTNVRIKLPAGTYTLSFGDYYRFSRLIFPTDKVFVSLYGSYYDNAGFPLHHIYVPKDVEEIVYEDKKGPGLNKRGFWLDPSGKRREAQKIRNTIYRVPVPPEFRGKLWTFSVGHRSFEILNIPNVFSLRKFDYREP